VHAQLVEQAPGLFGREVDDVRILRERGLCLRVPAEPGGPLENRFGRHG
jgi:hypothetical protein